MKSEKDIIHALKDGSDNAVELFLSHFSPLLYYIISPILHNDEDKEECISDIAMRVWKSIYLYDEQKGSFNGWITAIARNTAINHTRNTVLSDTLSESIPDGSPSPEDVVIIKEQQQALQKALNQLTSAERSLFFRKYYYLQSMSQIAAELGTTERAVEGRLYRIKKRLKKLLSREVTD